MTRWAKDLVLSEIMGESAGREVAKVLAPPLQAPKVTPFPDPFQSKVVSAKGSAQVYYLKMPEGHVGWIQYVGNNWFEDGEIYWYIDSGLVISPYINHQIAPVNMPKRVEPWLRVNDEIVWKVSNKSNLECLYEVLCDGFYCPLEDVPILIRLGLPISR